MSAQIKVKGSLVLFHDYIWQLDETGMKLDGELDVEQLGWQVGDYFKFVEENGVRRLIKIDVLEKFIIKGADNETND
jgi:hypothetical protein